MPSRKPHDTVPPVIASNRVPSCDAVQAVIFLCQFKRKYMLDDVLARFVRRTGDDLARRAATRSITSPEGDHYACADRRRCPRARADGRRDRVDEGSVSEPLDGRGVRAAAHARRSAADHHAVSLFMPAAVPSVGGLGLKVVSVFPDNPSRGLPTIHALVCLIDPEDGRPLAIMDGTYLTALRTGAVSGAATDLLALPDAHVLALFGTGAQAVTQAQAVCAVRDITEIRVVARSPEKGAAFIERVRARGCSDSLPRCTSPRMQRRRYAARTSSAPRRRRWRRSSPTPIWSGHAHQRGRRIHARDAGNPGGDRRPRADRRRSARGGLGRGGRPRHRAGPGIDYRR